MKINGFPKQKYFKQYNWSKKEREGLSLWCLRLAGVCEEKRWKLLIMAFSYGFGDEIQWNYTLMSVVDFTVIV